jgi:hypothetical protein
MDCLTDNYRVFNPAATKYTFFSIACRTDSKIYRILGNKASLNELKKIEITH